MNAHQEGYLELVAGGGGSGSVWGGRHSGSGSYGGAGRFSNLESRLQQLEQLVKEGKVGGFQVLTSGVWTMRGVARTASLSSLAV